MANQYQKWSDDEINLLRELAGKHPATEISLKIGRGYDACSKMIRKLGLPSYVPAFPPARPAATQKAVGRTKKTKEPVSPQWRGNFLPKKDVVVRKAPVQHISFPPLEYCMNCHSPVSSWTDHENRMRHMGCKRPAA
jgi:hypothetical protein